MGFNSEIITNAIKSAFESKGIKSLPGVDVDDLIKSITDSIMKSVDVKSIGGNLLGGLTKNLGNK